MNTNAARNNMITQQIRACNIINEQVIELLNNTPREEFVPKAYQQLAFADTNIPLAHNQVMMTPFEEANMLQALSIKNSDTVLEIGTGSGYVTALLAKSAKHVDSIDIFETFSKQAKQQLDNYNLYNVDFITADAANGWSDKQYDVIVITGSLPVLPANFRNAIKEGGRCYVTLGQAPAMVATLITRVSNQQWSSQKLFESDLQPLLYAKAIDQFKF